MISLKIKKYRPYADVTMVVKGEASPPDWDGLEVHLGMLDGQQLDNLSTQFERLVLQIDLLLSEYAEDE